MVRCVEEFRETLQSRNYIFHVHTNLTDGKNTVSEYAGFAHDKGFKYLLFVEHVSREMCYDFDEFVHTVEDARRAFAPLRIGLGVEAKMLPGGDLDITDDVLGKVGLLCIACHSFPRDKQLYMDSMTQAIERYIHPNRVSVWVHPGMFFMRKGITDDKTLLSLIEYAIWHGTYIEYNMKYGLPRQGVWGLVPASSRVIGTDAHSIATLEKQVEELHYANHFL